MKFPLLVVIFCFSINIFGQNAENLIKKCEQLQVSRQIDSVKKYAILALQKARAEKSDILISKSEYFLGNSLMRSAPDSGFKLIGKAEIDFTKRQDYKYLTMVSGSLGNYYGRIGKNAESINYYLKAREFADKYYTKSETDQYPRIIAAQNYNIGAAYFDMSEKEKAIEYIMKAAKVANQYNLKQFELNSMNFMGNIQLEMGQIDKAEKSFLQAKTLAKALNNLNLAGVILSNLGNIYNEKSMKSSANKSAWQKAKYFYDESLKIAISQNDFASIALRINNLAELEAGIKNFEKSIQHSLNALKYAEKSQSKLNRLVVLNRLAKSYEQINDTPKAIKTANEAILLSKELSNEQYIASLNKTLANAYSKEKNFTKALEYQNRLIEAKDSIYKSTLNSQIMELQTKYETEKKQKEIELLSAQNEINMGKIKQKNYLILVIFIGVASLIVVFLFWYKQRRLRDRQKAAEMKQRLLRAQLNPHFLFNSLNSIQRLYIEGKTDLANDFIADFAQMMRDILEKTGRTKIPIDEEIEFIASYLSLEKRRLGERFEYEINMDEDVRNSVFEVPSFIVQPLVENALLHGILPKNTRGKIEVLVEKLREEYLSISVIDNGIGFYNKKPDKTHISKGIELINNRLGKSGRLIINELKNQKAEIIGTKITLEIAC